MKKIALVIASVVAVFVLTAVILFIVVDADDFRGFIDGRRIFRCQALGS